MAKQNTEAEREQSEFNMSLSYLARLNYYFFSADDASANLQLYEWVQSLIILSRELRPYLNDKEWEERNQLMKKHLHDISHISQERQKIIDASTFWELDEFQAFLTDVCKKSGLLIKMQKSMADVFGEL